MSLGDDSAGNKLSTAISHWIVDGSVMRRGLKTLVGETKLSENATYLFRELKILDFFH